MVRTFRKSPPKSTFPSFRRWVLMGMAVGTALIAPVLAGNAIGMWVFALGLLIVVGVLSTDMFPLLERQDKTETKIADLARTTDRLRGDMTRITDDMVAFQEDLTEVHDQLAIKRRDDTKLFSSLRDKVDRLMRQSDAQIARAASYSQGRNTAAVQSIRAHPQLYAANDPVLSDDIALDLLKTAVSDNRLEVFGQSVVSLPARKMQYVELLARIRLRPGVFITAGRYVDLPEVKPYLNRIDHMLFATALDHMRTVTPDRPNLGYILNIAASTLKDRVFMTDLLKLLRADRLMGRRLMLELTQSEIDSVDANLLRVMHMLSETGVRFSMDRVLDPKLSIKRLQECRISMLKLDARRFLGLLGREDGMSAMQKFRARIDQAGLQLVAERIQTEADLRDLLDFEIDYGQGYLFGKPQRLSQMMDFRAKAA